MNISVEELKRSFSSKYPEVNGQTWDMFFKAAGDMDVILFGAGVLANRSFAEFRHLLRGIIDNDSRKWGLAAKDIIPSAAGDAAGDIPIEGPQTLSARDAGKTLVLIANAKYYEDIIEQISELGIKRYFVLKIMEANRLLSSPELLGDDVPGVMDELAERYIREPIEPKKVLFSDHMGAYAGHGKYITGQLLRQRGDLDIVWAVNDMTADAPEGVRLINARDPEKYAFELETAGVWVFDHVIPRFAIKRPGQVYINVKHWASVTLKTFGMDLEKFRNGPIGEIYIHNRDCMDYIIVGSDFDIASCRSGYAYDGAFAKLGSPRSDALFSGGRFKEKLCQRLGVPFEKKLLLYAPTYRHRSSSTYNESVSRIDLDFELLKQTLDSQGGDWLILLRLHPSVLVESYKVKKPPYVADVSTYEDVQELVAASDAMVTDYSSIMFEPAFVKKPVFLLATDLEEYLRDERGLLIDYRTLPFPVALSNEQLADNIRSFDYEAYKAGVDAFLSKYGVCEDGHASERAARFISDLIDKAGGVK